jgi:hypothetical protein
MMKLENNQNQYPYVAGTHWNKTPNGEFCTLDEYLPSHGVILVVKQLFGTQNQENLVVYVLPANWAQNNPEFADP